MPRPDDDLPYTPPSERPTPPDAERTPPARPSAMPPPEFLPTRKMPRASAPRESPRPSAAELLDRADEAEIALRRPGWEVTNPGLYATNGYAKGKARRYALYAALFGLGMQAVTQLLPLVVELYEKHLDRQTQRSGLKAGP